MDQPQASGIQPRKEQPLRESSSLYFEDFTLGNIVQHQQGRTVTEVDNMWQSLISMNAHPLHKVNKSNPAKELNHKTLVSSLVTLSIVGGLSLASAGARSVKNLGWKQVSLPHPVFVGDTLYAESKILSKSRSESRPDQGIVTVETRGLNQQGQVCLIGQRSFVMPCRWQDKETV